VTWERGEGAGVSFSSCLFFLTKGLRAVFLSEEEVIFRVMVSLLVCAPGRGLHRHCQEER